MDKLWGGKKQDCHVRKKVIVFNQVQNTCSSIFKVQQRLKIIQALVISDQNAILANKPEEKKKTYSHYIYSLKTIQFNIIPPNSTSENKTKQDIVKF